MIEYFADKNPLLFVYILLLIFAIISLIVVKSEKGRHWLGID